MNRLRHSCATTLISFSFEGGDWGHIFQYLRVASGSVFKQESWETLGRVHMWCWEFKQDPQTRYKKRVNLSLEPIILLCLDWLVATLNIMNMDKKKVDEYTLICLRYMFYNDTEMLHNDNILQSTWMLRTMLIFKRMIWTCCSYCFYKVWPALLICPGHVLSIKMT